MSIIRRYIDYMDRFDEGRQDLRGFWLGGALFCAAALGYTLGSDHFGPNRMGFLLLWTALLLSSLQRLVLSQWLRHIVLPIGYFVLGAIAIVMLIRGQVL